MSNILLVGSGGCGGKLLDTGLTIIDESFGLGNTYDPAFINSNLNEMEVLQHFKIGVNGIHITGQGTGRDREIAKYSIRDDSSKVYNYFAPKAPNYQMALVIFSADGGFGNGSIETICRVLKNLNPNLNITLLGAMPKYNSRKIAIENALLLHKDVLKLRKDNQLLGEDETGNQVIGRLVDSVIYINNEMMDKEDIDKELIEAMKEDEDVSKEEIKRLMDKETKFNFKVMEQVIQSLDLHGGAVDISDTLKVNSASGYRVILPLSDETQVLTEAIESSIENSPFVLPSELDDKEDEELIRCSHLVGVYDEDNFGKDDWQDIFDATVFEKNDYSEGTNFIVANGFKMPTAHMNMLKNTLSKLNEIASDDDDDEFDIDIKRENKVKTVKSANNRTDKSKPHAQTTSSASTATSKTQSVLEKRKKLKNVRGLF
jgi:hypothetical protein